MTEEINIRQNLDDLLKNMATIMPNVLTTNDFHARKFDLYEMEKEFKYLEMKFHEIKTESTYKINLGFDVNLDIYPCLIHGNIHYLIFDPRNYLPEEPELHLPIVPWSYYEKHIEKIREFIKDGKYEPFICCSLSIGNYNSKEYKYLLKCDVCSSEFSTFVKEIKAKSSFKELQLLYERNQEIIEENRKEQAAIDETNRKDMELRAKKAAEEYPMHVERVKKALHSCGYNGRFELEVTYASYHITLTDRKIRLPYVMQDNYEEEIRKNLEGKKIS